MTTGASIDAVRPKVLQNATDEARITEGNNSPVPTPPIRPHSCVRFVVWGLEYGICSLCFVVSGFGLKFQSCEAPRGKARQTERETIFPLAVEPARWTTTLSLKVNSPQAIISRALYGGNLVIDRSIPTRVERGRLINPISASF